MAAPPLLALMLALASFSLLPLAISVANTPNFELLKNVEARGGSLCEQLIGFAGYPCQEHTVQTRDGFILSLQRVSASTSPPSSVFQSSPRRPSVLLLHGILTGGDAWFLNNNDESLGFILSDHGFDVWVANVRGTRWSNKHISLSNKSKEYWDWSWEEMAFYDLPAMLEYISRETRSKVLIVGYSQGTIMTLAALTQPKIADMVEAVALLSPISYLGHMNSSLLRRMLDIHLDQMAFGMGFHQINLRSDKEIKLMDSLCQGRLDCSDLITSVTGKNCCLNMTGIDFFFQFIPHPTSVKNLKHLVQMIRQNTFAKYDYGKIQNMIRYGSFRPPAFDLSLLPKSLPVWMAHGKNDALADVTDVRRTIRELPCKKEVIYLDNYGHLDFMWGVRSKDDVYGHMVEFFNSLGNSSSF